ncbi:MAG: radical SAM family heme chaperone HemW [Planctomycetota bacterium]|nr:radical SAM family heme chaperone HemW [Planctomycetota bacterium]
MTRAPEGTPLYVHLPFCAAKCPYCDFFSLPVEGQETAPVLAGLLREAEERAPRHPRTVFLGGGTPSLHTCEELAQLLDRLHAITGFRDSAEEVTAECNPESLDRDKAACLLAAGVDRLSIGFQSLRPKTLELFGRVHSVDQSFRAFEAARAAGCRRLSVDLIYAAPGQDLASWAEDLQRVVALGPDHLSAYALAFERATPFAAWLADGRIERADEELELALFRHTHRILAEHGLIPYEVSNFSSAQQECRHNVNYWRNGTYVGIGPSAVSKVGHTRRGNPRSIGAWLEAVDARPSRPAWEETLPPRERLGETWWLGLRLVEGVEPARARRTAGFEDAADPAQAIARRLAADGLLQEQDGRFRLSHRGLPLGDAVAREFLAPGQEVALDARPDGPPVPAG